MKKLITLTALFALATSVAPFSNVAQSNAASISNPKCVQGLREAQSRSGYQAFAMISGGKHCGWTIQSSSSQAEANRTALHYCNARPHGKKCHVVWPN
jgi:hypothetical protein